jgi:hypothetical protein
MGAERRREKALGEPYEGEPHVRFDEGVLETELRRRLNGHEAGNGGDSQGEASGPPRQRPTLQFRPRQGFMRERYKTALWPSRYMSFLSESGARTM